MNNEIAGTGFDGEKLEGQPVSLRLEAGRLIITAAGATRDYPLAGVRVSDRLAQVPRYLYFPDRTTVEAADNDAIDALLPLLHRGRIGALVHWLEMRSRVAAAATVLLVTTVTAVVYFGLPLLAKKVAYAVPSTVEAQAGEVALATFDRFLRPSDLEPAERLRVTQLLERLVQAGGTTRKVRVVFRSMGGKSPNAFALPGGTIVVSDEMVHLATIDEELMAVLAHELGHVERRHGLQSVLRGSAALLVVSTVTGDLSTLTSFSGTIPFMLLQRGYSREFESEADDYALEVLRKAKIDPWYFASILEKLGASRAEPRQDYSYLSTHPSNADRIRRINPSGHQPAGAARQVAGTALQTEPKKFAAMPLATSGARTTTQTFDFGDTKPRPVSEPPPIYPADLAKEGIEGEVMVEFIIDENGDVQNPRIKSSTHKGFETAALTAVRGWKFTPGRHSGTAVSTRAAIPVEFRLDDQPATASAAEKANRPTIALPDSIPSQPSKP